MKERNASECEKRNYVNWVMISCLVEEEEKKEGKRWNGINRRLKTSSGGRGGGCEPSGQRLVGWLAAWCGLPLEKGPNLVTIAGRQQGRRKKRTTSSRGGIQI
jgi:hypothetical protein